MFNMTFINKVIHSKTSDPYLMININYVLLGISGRDPDPKMLKDMLAEAPGQINFTAFLTLFGEKMHGKVKNVYFDVYLAFAIGGATSCEPKMAAINPA